jgi:hypothetical protein
MMPATPPAVPAKMSRAAKNHSGRVLDSETGATGGVECARNSCRWAGIALSAAPWQCAIEEGSQGTAACDGVASAAYVGRATAGLSAVGFILARMDGCVERAQLQLKKENFPTVRWQ